MKLKKLYSYKTNRQIWRLLLSEKNRLIIEDRDPKIKEVFFSCLNAATGKKIFSEIQFDEKFWIGIEAIYKEIIFFHKFEKPDMPGHKMILAYSIDEQRILWQNDKYNFLFVKDDLIYTFRQLFESRSFFSLDYLTGEMVEELGTDPLPVNSIREKLYSEDNYKNYYFPESLNTDAFDPGRYSFIKSYIDENQTGTVECIKYGEYFLMNYHKKQNSSLTNIFVVLDMNKRKPVMREVINQSSKAIVPDSFFIKDNLLFLLKERQQLVVFRIE